MWYEKRILWSVLFSLIIGFSSFYSSYGQNTISNQIYEANTRYSNDENDTAYINYLIQKGSRYSSDDSASIILQKSLRLSKANNYYSGIVYSLINLSRRQKNADMSLAYCFQALAYNHQWRRSDTNVAHVRGLIYYYIGLEYATKGQYSMSMYYFYKVLENWQQHASSGTALIREKYTHRTVPANLLVIFGTYYKIANIWSKMGNVSQALYYYRVAEHIAKVNKDTALLAHAWNGLASYYHDVDSNIEKCYYYCYKVLELPVLPQYILEAENAKLILGNNLLTDNRPQETITLANGILKNNDSLLRRVQISSDSFFITYAYLLLGNAYAQLKDYKLAEIYLQRGLQARRTTGSVENITETHSLLADIYEATGQYKKAFEHEKKFAVLKDSLIVKNKKTINELETANQMAVKNKELMQNRLVISQQQNRLDNKNLWLAGVSVVSLFFVVIGASIYKNFKQKQKVLKREQEIVELKALMSGEEAERSRIARDLHDGIISQLSAVRMNFNALPNQNPELKSNPDYRESIEQLETTIKELRTTAHNLMPEVLLNGGILEAVHVFCEKISRNSGVDIDYQTYGVMPLLEQSFELSIYRIVQELVHNIIKHAQASSALVQISCKNDLLSIIIEDNGVGIDESNIAATKGRGLINLKERIKLLRGHLDINSSETSGTAIYIEFDIATNKKSEPICI